MVEARLHTGTDVKFDSDSPNGAKFVSEEADTQTE